MATYKLPYGQASAINAYVEWSYNDGILSYRLYAGYYKAGQIYGTWKYRSPKNSVNFIEKWGTLSNCTLVQDEIEVETDDQGYITTSLRFDASIDGKNAFGDLQGLRAYVPKIPLSAPSISNTPTVYYKNPLITITWTGRPDAPHTQQLVLTDGYHSITIDLDRSVSSYTFSETQTAVFSLGAILTAKIKAVAQDNIYKDSEYSSKELGYINTPPEPPTATPSSQTVSSSSPIVFQVIPGLDYDADPTTILYSINGGTRITFVSPLSISLQNQGVIEGNNIIAFYTKDVNNEYSNPTTVAFFASFIPVVEQNILTQNTYVKDRTDAVSTLVSSTKITYTLISGVASNYELHLRTSASQALSGDIICEANEAVIFNSNSKTVTIDISKISPTIIPYGNYFQFALRLTSGEGYSEQTNWSTIGRRAMLPQLPTNVICTNDGINATAKENYFKNQVTVSGNLVQGNTAYATVNQIKVQARYGEEEKTFTCNISGDNFSQVLDLTAITDDQLVDIYLTVIDMLGQESNSQKLFTVMRASELAYGGNLIAVNPTILKPLSNVNPFQITHPVAQSTGTANEDVQYSYRIVINNTQVPVPDFTWELSPDRVDAAVAANIIKDALIFVVPNTNSIYNARIVATATDGFGSAVEIYTDFTVNFIEPPILPNLPFKLRHDYQISNTSAMVGLGEEVGVNSSLDARMFNYKEGLVFMIPRANDLNDDIMQYEIYLSRTDLEKNIQIELDTSKLQFSPTPFLILTKQQLEDGAKDSNYYYYRYSTSQYVKNEYFYFKLLVRDSFNNISAQAPISSTYIIGCRTLSPSFNIGNVAVNRIGNTVTLNYNLSIVDLGGSAPSDGWDVDYYNAYPNFERNLSGYIPKITLKVDLSADQNFEQNVTTNVYGYSPLSEFTSHQIVIEDFPSTNPRLYIRFTLLCSYGFDSTKADGLAAVSSLSQSYSYFGEIPTISHRSHRVGINSNTFDESEVLVIENYQNNRYITLRGSDINISTQVYEIKIDLATGTIDGAIIDCGSW